MNKMNKKIKKMTLISMFAAVALTVFVIESQLPPLSPFPGVKPGLANVVTLLILQLGGNWKFRDALSVLLIRVILSAVITGQPTALFYSLGGGVAALLIMAAIKVLPIGKFPPFMSIAGALAHNIAQLLIACVLLSSATVFAYLPVYLVSGAVTGLFTGFGALFLLNRSEFITILKE